MARTRIGRGELDTRHHGESHLDAVRRFLVALHTHRPVFFKELRELASHISRGRLGRGSTLDGFLVRYNLAPAWDPDHPRGFPLRYRLVDLARECLKSPAASFPELIDRIGRMRDPRLEVELAIAYEGRQRVLYARTIGEARARLLARQEPQVDSSEETQSAIQLATDILDALQHPYDETRHDLIAGAFSEAQEMLGVPAPERWCFPRHGNRADPLAPLEANPLLETRQEFEERARMHWEARRRVALDLGFPETPVKEEDAHWGWLVRFQVGGESYESIALRANFSDGGQSATPHAIRKGVSAAAKLLNLEVRKERMGRPPGRSLSTKRRA